MQPDDPTSHAPDTHQSPGTASASPVGAGTSTPTASPPSTSPPASPVPPIAASPPAMMTTPLQQEAAFQTFRPARDVWKMAWKFLIGLNFAIGLMFAVFAGMRFTGVASYEFQAGAMGAPFWLLPVLLIFELAAVVAFAIMKRPKLDEVKSVLKWLGIGLVTAFIAGIGFVVYASIS